MAGFILEFTFDDNSMITIEGQNVRYWIGEGLPAFYGTIDEFAENYPEHIKELINYKILKVLSK